MLGCFLLDRAGIDGGGVFKEFFTSLCKEVFDTDRGLWLANKKNELYPNPHAYATECLLALNLWLSSRVTDMYTHPSTLLSSQPQLVSLHRTHPRQGPLRRYSR